MTASARRFRLFAACWSAAVGLWAAVAAQHPSSATDENVKLANRVAELVRQLDSDDLNTRTMAEQQLKDLGPEALKHLSLTAGGLSAEAAQRLGHVRATLQRAAAATQLAASQLHLAGVQTARRWMEEIRRQTGNPIRLEKDDPNPWKLEIGPAPFWQALELLLTDRQLVIDDRPSTRPEIVLRPIELPAARLPAVFDGPFRIQMHAASAGSRATGRAEIQLRWEPRLSPIELSLNATDLTVQATAGKPVETFDPATRLRFPVRAADGQATVSIPLRTSEQRIETFRGQMTALVMADPVELGLPSPGILRQRSLPFYVHRSATCDVSIEHVGATDQGILFEFLVNYYPQSAGAQLDSHLAGLIDVQLVFQTANREPTAPRRRLLSVVDRTKLRAVFELATEDPAGVISAQLALPLVMDQIPLEFEFLDILLQ